jgi:CRISPR-associated endonuclease Cas1/group II intron reverse transcriptase/maturase
MQIADRRLHEAWRKVRRGSKSPGIDGITVEMFDPIATENLAQLKQQLANETYNPRPAKSFYLQKTSGGKRLIGISTVRDRIIQRLLLDALYRPLENTFVDISYAYRPGRSIHQAADRLAIAYRDGQQWILKADIEAFFDRLCHALLIRDLEQLNIPDTIRAIVVQSLRAGIWLNGQIRHPGMGVTQGNVLSGALANLYLTEFDRRCLDAGFNIVRYGDDLAIACNTPELADHALTRITGWLNARFVSLAPEKTKIFAPDEAFAFLGYRFDRGEVFVPPPPQIRTGFARPYGATPTIRKPGRRSGRPIACARSRSKLTPLTVSPLQYFAEPMTTLYVTEQGAYLKVKNYQFLVFYQHELRCQVPANRVTHIVLFGCCNLSHGAVSLALRRRIPVMYLSQKGRYFGRLGASGEAKVEYLTRQAALAEDPAFAREQSEAIVRAKLHNSRVVLLRLSRGRRDDRTKAALKLLATLIDDLPLAQDLETLRGYEGKAATTYFQSLGGLVAASFGFEGRTKRPPKDPANSLMSLGYTLLSHNVHAFVEAIGLHPHFGTLHANYDSRPALVCDLMEEFRATVVDALVVYLLNSKIFTIEDFTPPDERGGVYLHQDALRTFVKHWEERLQLRVTHTVTGLEVTYRRCIELQVREYVACLLGDVPVYRPMVWPVK